MGRVLTWGALTLGALTATGCGEDDSVRLQTLTGDVLVVTTDDEVGSYAVVSAIGDRADVAEASLHPDATCRYDPVTDQFFVVARRGYDAIQQLSPEEGWSVTREFSVEAGSNPQDIAVLSPERAYVARYDTSELLVVDPRQGSILERQDLAPYDNADGNPEVAWLGVHEGRVYAVLQRLDRNAGLAPSQPGLVLQLDGATGEVQGSLELTGSNPFGRFRYNPVLQRFVVIQSGAWNALDGGVELLDPTTFTVSGWQVTEAALGGDVVDAVLVSSTQGYALVCSVSDTGQSRSRLVAFNPATGVVGATLLEAEGWNHVALALSPDHTRLWVTDRTPDAPGVRIFDTDSDTEVSDRPLEVGLPPFAICFGNTSLTATAENTAYADTVVDTPCASDALYTDPQRAVNGVRGAGAGRGSVDVFSLRACGNVADRYLTVRWSNRVVKNGLGTDFAVFENGFAYPGGRAFMEPMVVSLSQDGQTWIDFPHRYRHEPPTEFTNDPGAWEGFAGVEPVLYHEDRPVPIWVPEEAGGDHYDLDALSDEGLAGRIKREGFVYLKVTHAAAILNPTTGAQYPPPPANQSFDQAPDIDGVYARYLAGE